MKYSLRSLLLDALLAVPFLVSGVLAVWCAREAIADYEMLKTYRKIVPFGVAQPWERP